MWVLLKQHAQKYVKLSLMSYHSLGTPFYKGRILTSSNLTIRVGDEMFFSRKGGVGLKGQNCLERGDSLLWHVYIYIYIYIYIDCRNIFHISLLCYIKTNVCIYIKKTFLILLNSLFLYIDFIYYFIFLLHIYSNTFCSFLGL